MDRKEEILTHAADLVQTNGYSSFSYGDLSARLGIRKASIHHHFASKEALGEALCDKYLNGLFAFRREVDGRGGGAWTRLRSIFAMAGCNADTQRMCPAGSLQAEWATLPERLRERLKALDEAMLDWVASVLEDGRGAGEMHFAGEARSQAMMVLSALQGSLQQARVHGCSVYRAVVAQLEQSMGAGSTSGGAP